jgi:hypothetical protein
VHQWLKIVFFFYCGFWVKSTSKPNFTYTDQLARLFVVWNSRTKIDLIIEVWEKLDCESVGAEEILAIEKVILDQFGRGAIDSPMKTARILADEGAQLRHSEIMTLDVERRLQSPYDAVFRNAFNFSTFKETISSLKNLENLRKKFIAENDKIGLRLMNAEILKAKELCLNIANRKAIDENRRLVNLEIAEWLTVWMQTPEMFEIWVSLRQNSPNFKSIF